MSYYCIDEEKQPQYAICDKCKDTYEMHRGRYSYRKSCRKHKWIGNSCRDCKEFMTMSNKNSGCYHVSFDLCCYCIIS